MPYKKKFELEGVIPATLISFNEDLSIDEQESRKHISFCAGTKGISAITVNGHSSEIHACNIEEQKRILNFLLKLHYFLRHILFASFLDETNW